MRLSSLPARLETVLYSRRRAGRIERRKPFPATVKPQDQDPTVGIPPILVVGGVGASEMRKLRAEERRNMSNLYFSTCLPETSTRGLDIDPNLPCFLFLFFPGGVDRLTSRVWVEEILLLNPGRGVAVSCQAPPIPITNMPGKLTRKSQQRRTSSFLFFGNWESWPRFGSNLVFFSLFVLKARRLMIEGKAGVYFPPMRSGFLDRSCVLMGAPASPD